MPDAPSAPPAYSQVKSPAPDNTWTAIDLSAQPLGGSLGADGGMSGVMVVDGQQALVHCGGQDQFTDDGVSSDCFALRMSSSGEVVVDSLAPLPQPRRYSCHGSDGGRLVVAGGLDDGDHRQQSVWVLEGVTSNWAAAAVNLSSARDSSAGLLLGDQLVCMGGIDEEVG